MLNEKRFDKDGLVAYEKDWLDQEFSILTDAQDLHTCPGISCCWVLFSGFSSSVVILDDYIAIGGVSGWVVLYLADGSSCKWA